TIRHTPPGPRILTWFPSTTPFGLVLGAGSTCADSSCAGTLGLSARGHLTLFVATHVSIRTSDTSTVGYPSASLAYGTLRYRLEPKCQTLSFGASLEPRYIFAAGTLI